jgi:hypothetical protein
MKQSWEGMQYGKDVKTAGGTLKWRPGSGGTEEFRDRCAEDSARSGEDAWDVE